MGSFICICQEFQLLIDLVLSIESRMKGWVNKTKAPQMCVKHQGMCTEKKPWETLNSVSGCIGTLYRLQFLFFHQKINIDKRKWSNKLSSAFTPEEQNWYYKFIPLLYLQLENSYSQGQKQTICFIILWELGNLLQTKPISWTGD